MAALAVLAGCDRTPQVILTPASGASPVTVTVEVVDTDESRSRGLMYRTEMAEDHGMIFFFEKEAKHAFWMKNTPLPLDMIFISSDGRIVGVAADAEPFSLAPRGVDAPSRAVLEVNAGFAKRHGLAPGDGVVYRNVSSPLLP